jgi:hypothetical protein
MSVNEMGAVSIINVPLFPTWAVNQISPALLPPSQVASGTDELVAAVSYSTLPVQLTPTVSGIALHGSSLVTGNK